jgi:hypothetical protein
MILVAQRYFAGLAVQTNLLFNCVHSDLLHNGKATFNDLPAFCIESDPIDSGC